MCVLAIVEPTDETRYEYYHHHDVQEGLGLFPIP